MSQRHILDVKRVETALTRLDELVRANSGNDTFDEVLKILLVKLYCERFNVPLVSKNATESHSMFTEHLLALNKEWSGILNVTDLECSLSAEHLHICLNSIAEVKVFDENLESLDAFFEYLVSKGSKGEKGQFFTPRHVIDCCVKMLNPMKGETVCDPACGSGGFLVHSISHMAETSSPNSDDIWGFDFDEKAIKVAKASMTIAGYQPNNLFNLNSLLRPQKDLLTQLLNSNEKQLSAEDIFRTKLKKFEGFDVILTNPPFAGEIQELSLLNSYALAKKNKRNERDVLFIERCIELLAPNGRIAIVLPHNKIGGKAFSYVREWLLKNAKVLAVVSLPRTTFLPHTHQKAEVIIAVKREKVLPSPPDEEIMMMVSTKSAKDTKGNLIYKTEAQPSNSNWESVDHDLDDLVQVFSEFKKKQNLGW